MFSYTVNLIIKEGSRHEEMGSMDVVGRSICSTGAA